MIYEAMGHQLQPLAWRHVTVAYLGFLGLACRTLVEQWLAYGKSQIGLRIGID